MRWAPLFDADGADRDDAARVRAAIDSLVTSEEVADPSFAGGSAGLAVMHAELGDLDRAHDALAHALGAVGELDSPWLATGVLGVAWAAASVADVIELDDDVLATFDAIAAELLGLDAWSFEIELLYGLAGVAAYARARGRTELLARAVAHLDRAATRDADGATWIVRGESPPRCDLGLAHGATGAIAVLAAACADGIDAARPLLDDAIAWLDAHARPRGTPVFPMYVGIDPPGKIRNGWCYGDLAIAHTLAAAGNAAHRAAWIDRARAVVAQSIHEDPIGDVADVDLTFCHGVAGRAHLLHRLALALDDPQLHAAARATTLETLARLSSAPAAPGLLIGRAGIALALHGSISTIEPRWDRAFLIARVA